jgi:hypothetical protein
MDSGCSLQRPVTQSFIETLLGTMHMHGGATIVNHSVISAFGPLPGETLLGTMHMHVGVNHSVTSTSGPHPVRH